LFSLSDEQKYILPLKNFYKKNDAINYIKWVGQKKKYQPHNFAMSLTVEWLWRVLSNNLDVGFLHLSLMSSPYLDIQSTHSF
jgi:hypothetical protein